MAKSAKRDTPPLTDESVELLRYAIVKQACKDYNAAYFMRKQLERQAKSSKLSQKDNKALYKAQQMEAECLEFFRSAWYATLCSVDPEKLIGALKARRLHEGQDD